LKSEGWEKRSGVKVSKSAAEEGVEVACPMSDNSSDHGAHSTRDFFAVRNDLDHEIELYGLSIYIT
jgi:hypothetical protein